MKVKLKTLTPTHVGSGIDFQGNVEYLWFADQRQAAVLDDEKTLEIIGAENIGQWVSCIEKGEPLLPLLQKRSPNLTAERVARRVVRQGRGAVEPHKTLREQLHTASGAALLPGSSLKGALRTAVFAEEIVRQPALAKEISNLGESRFNKFSGKEKFDFKADLLSQRIFGKDPNHDIFRLWQIGDAMFDEPTAVFRTEVVNLYRENEYRLKSEIVQQIEAIPAGATAETQWRFNELLQRRASNSQIFNRNADLLRPEKLFSLVNQHTRRLLENEIKFWKEQGNPAVLGSFVEDLERMLAAVGACDASSCVLRLGWGTGFRSMTGDWHIHMTDDDYYDLVAALRPTHDETLQFPKTTRLVAGGEPLGFLLVSFS